MTRRKTWSKSIGERGHRIRLYEVRPGGPIMRSTWIDGKEVRKSLGHRDKDMAIRQAYEMLASLHTNESAFDSETVEMEEGGLWHTLRRKWATERKGYPVKDVAAAGGWQDVETLLKSYLQTDPDTVRRIVLNPTQRLASR